MSETSSVNIVRIDDGARAKLQCQRCGGDTYVLIIGNEAGASVEAVTAALADAARGHLTTCPA